MGKMKKKTVNLTKEVEQSFKDLEEKMPDNSVMQELVIGDEDSTLEMDPVDLREDDLQDKFDWLAAPIDDWQRRIHERVRWAVDGDTKIDDGRSE